MKEKITLGREDFLKKIQKELAMKKKRRLISSKLNLSIKKHYLRELPDKLCVGGGGGVDR